jgi:hypothetical protein
MPDHISSSHTSLVRASAVMPSAIPLRILPLALVWGTLAAAQERNPAPTPVRVDGGPTTGTAVRASRAPVIDAREDDDAWRDTPPLPNAWRQFQPGEDAAPSFRTEAKIAYDDRNIYVLVRAFDPHPDSIVPLLSRRDVRTNSDQIKVVIDAYHDRRSGLQFMINPAGVKRDASIYSDVVEDMSWDGVWDAAARIDSLGWVAEFRIPLSQLRFSAAPSHTFGFGIWRDIARKNERISWPIFRSSRNAFASQLGEIAGITGISPSRRFELLPYVVAKNVSEPFRTGGSIGTQNPPGILTWRRDQQITAGADFKYGVTSNLTLDATINPDFGQVEADPSILNLTAFEVRFEERRPFFQEGVQLFKCGGPCEGIFYTRRIGRLPQLRSEKVADNDPAFTRIAGAAKLTGRLHNGVSVGLVEAVTQREIGHLGTTIEPQTNYAVGRVYKEMREGRSGLGFMLTGVNRDLDADTRDLLRRDAYTTLVQGFHRFSRERFELMAYAGFNEVFGSDSAIALTQRNSVHLYQRPDHEERYDPTRTRLAGSVKAVQFQKLGGAARFSTFFRHADPGVELNDLGFVPIVNDVSLRNTFDLNSLQPTRFYRRALAELETFQSWTTGGLPSGLTTSLILFAELPNLWSPSIEYDGTDFGGVFCVACARGGPALRRSAQHQIKVGVDGDPRPVVVPHVSVTYARGDEGRSTTRGASGLLDLRIASRFSMSVGPEYEHKVDDQQWYDNYGALLSDTTHFTFAHLDQTTLSMTTRASFTATPNFSIQLYAQPFVSSGAFSNWRELNQPRARDYDARFRPYGGGANPEGFNFKELRSSLVARWEYRPGSTLFLVWTQGRKQDDLDPGSFQFRRDYHNLFRARPDNTFLVKGSYWFSL